MHADSLLCTLAAPLQQGGFPAHPPLLQQLWGAPTSATPLACDTHPDFSGCGEMEEDSTDGNPARCWCRGCSPMDADFPWLSRARVRCRGMTHACSLPVADLAPVVRSREHPVPERQAAAQAGVSHGGSVAELRPGNPGGNPWGAAGEQGAASSMGCLSALAQDAVKPHMPGLPPSLPSTAPLGTNRRTPSSR